MFWIVCKYRDLRCNSRIFICSQHHHHKTDKEQSILLISSITSENSLNPKSSRIMQFHHAVNASCTPLDFSSKMKPFPYSYPKYPIQEFLPDLLRHQFQKYASHAYIWDTGKHSYFELVLKPVKGKERKDCSNEAPVFPC